MIRSIVQFIQKRRPLIGITFHITCLAAAFGFIFPGTAKAQQLQQQIQLPTGLSDTLFSTYYQQRVSLFRLMPASPGQIVFLGNSITDGGAWDELFSELPGIINRGISGDLTAGVLNRLDEVTRRKPSKIFLLIGTNDLARGISTDSVLHNIFLIAKLIHKSSPATRLYIQSIFPVNPYYHKFAGHTSNTAKINTINQALAGSAGQLDYTFIDVFDVLKDADGLMDINLTNDGLHLKGPGYMRWKHLIYPYVMEVTQKAALLPLPKSLQWQPGKLPLYHLQQITYRQDSLKDLATVFAKSNFRLLPQGVNIVKEKTNKAKASFSLRIECVNDLKWPSTADELPCDERAKEGYMLQVTGKRITLKATTRHGIFNGLQTLRQLMRDGCLVDNCQIYDYPSFAWRGYMIDVGRNYQPMAMIKKQIDIISALKLNIFHFHLTEDVAWRLAIKKYPQLTEPATMTRDQGLFYTQSDIKKLINYCKDRFITFIPEIDMPGHSAAFKRAMGFDMQSDSGISVVKEILHEICDTYDLPYIHIGADEVHIHNKAFLPTMMQLLTKRGKKVIGWDPGGQYTPEVYRQLWRGSQQALAPATYKRIDSRNLYINHMAPEESVVSIYNHAIDDQPGGDTNNIGATLCLWNDRNLASPMGNFTQNPTLASLLAFAERSWRGGGIPGNKVGLNHLTSDQQRAFAAFEDRLLSIQRDFYKGIPFQYVRQSNIKWQLIGPFDNKGHLTAIFPPEKNLNDPHNGYKATDVKTQTVTGGTIILRHFWDPVTKGLLDSPKENSTYYAKGRYYSPVDTSGLLWVGFYDNSRSTASAPPQEGTWNKLDSKIWLNGLIIEPPQWQRAGQGPDLEIPYVDENYYFREPIRVQLKKGWNELLLKMPVGTFNSGVWYSPVKWMFTAMFVQPQPGSSVHNMEQAASLYEDK